MHISLFFASNRPSAQRFWAVAGAVFRLAFWGACVGISSAAWAAEGGAVERGAGSARSGGRSAARSGRCARRRRCAACRARRQGVVVRVANHQRLRGRHRLRQRRGHSGGELHAAVEGRGARRQGRPHRLSHREVLLLRILALQIACKQVPFFGFWTVEEFAHILRILSGRRSWGAGLRVKAFFRGAVSRS